MKAMVLALGLAAVLAAVIGLSLALSLDGAQAQGTGPAAPANVRAVNGASPGQAVMMWDAVNAAAYYRIGWVNMETFRALQAEGGREWLDVFAFYDVVNRRQTTQTLSDLEPGVEYAFIVGSVGQRFGVASGWSGWTYLTTAADTTSCPTDAGTPTPTPQPTATPAPSATPAATATPTPSPTPTQTSSRADSITSSSTTAGATVQLTLTIGSLPHDMAGGSSIELYLEDDFNVPTRIDPGSVYFTASGPRTATTNYGGRVYATDPIEIGYDDHFAGNDDWSIRVFLPDFNTGSNFDGFNGPMAGQELRMVILRSAGILNPTEEGTHSAGYSVLSPTDDGNDGPQVQLGNLRTYAKITLSDEDNVRGYRLTVTGSGFNNGATAAVYVLADPDTAADLGAMVAAGGASEAAACSTIITEGHRAGAATVGSDDRVAITFEVTVPPFRPGPVNYLCMSDSEGRTSSTDVEMFELITAN